MKTKLVLSIVLISLLASCASTPRTETIPDSELKQVGNKVVENLLARKDYITDRDSGLHYAEACTAELMEAQPNINVIWEWRPGDGFWDKLQTEFAAGVAPDVTVNQMNWVIPAAARGMWLSITPFIERDQIDMSAYWYPHELEWEWKGQLYAGLLYAGGEAHYINLDLLEESGLPFPVDHPSRRP